VKLLIVGAGAWGTALAVQTASRHEVTLWARDASLVQALQHQRLDVVADRVEQRLVYLLGPYLMRRQHLHHFLNSEFRVQNNRVCRYDKSGFLSASMTGQCQSDCGA
jgi:ketopantoate reductase